MELDDDRCVFSERMFIIYTYISIPSDRERQNWNVIKN